MTPKRWVLLQQASEKIRAARCAQFPRLNLFLFFDEQFHPRLLPEFEHALSPEFSCITAEIELSPPSTQSSPSETIYAIGVNSRRIEGFRDVIKRVLWQHQQRKSGARTYATLMRASHDQKVQPFRLSDYGVFTPYRVKTPRTIRVHSFGHEPFYRYRLCTPKIPGLPKSLREYLWLLFEDCPNHLYKADGFRASQQRFMVKVPLYHTQTHVMIDLAGASRDYTRFTSRHENLQLYFLEHDPCSFACEIPVWTEAREIQDYAEVFGTDAPLTGHIDLLRYTEHRVEVWDYKPNALNEVTAVTQVFLYALMLSIRTGLSLRRFRCGYFDERDLYWFNPHEAQLSPSHHHI
ncbi:hypothetical protein U27_00672 [Candidatus Vecturithrix granuli]|uniref:PD-(D/E)XK endonuclease-like domain-containing protein n=1 Tax=Vecturithrix granuli TaxID=1499967 RepID=A0A081C869_VECG1|nr:hypothetical protein U27_00672 [Candidatus Vecturithrix granuli]